MTDLGRRSLAEGLGTALLLVVVVGSGIAVERLGSDPISQLLAHALVVGLGLAALIALLLPVSGAHFNPAVTLGFWLRRQLPSVDAVAYVAAQLAGAAIGVVVANLTFSLAAMSVATTSRDGLGRPMAEGIATLGLVLVILGLIDAGRAPMIPAGVGAWVAAAIVATSSTGFANPAVTVGRVLTDTFTGIAPSSVPAYLAAQLAGAAAAVGIAAVLFPRPSLQPATIDQKGGAA